MTLFSEYNENELVEEIAPKKKKAVVTKLSPEDLENRLTKMEQKENSFLDIIATYIRQKPVTIENSKQLALVVSRFCRVAKQLEGAYTNEQIFSAIKELQKENTQRKLKGQVPIDWTIETILKTLTKK